MDDTDRRIVNALQGGFPLCSRPYREAASRLGMDEHELLSRLRTLLDTDVLTRFGPMYDVERMGGAFTLCAMSVPAADLERVGALVNAHAEVAHNYERAHRFNVWFVMGGTSHAALANVVSQIEAETGYPVMNLPREAEFFVELRLSA
ncbi:MAG TPA: AsnC family transcriptional regulator [Burkholderiales bacterium]|nr:AsnC family transcriptional regulator [Burkholderiales bacterium]